MKFVYKRSNILRGFLIYASGDTIAALLQQQYSFTRMLGMMLVGATVYAFEVPNYFRWLDRKLERKPGLAHALKRGALSVLYFNPIWIARHMLFIKLFSGLFTDISPDLFRIAAISFVVNLPITFTANFLIQNKVPLRHRFLASALFSASMAVYYALAVNWFK